MSRAASAPEAGGSGGGAARAAPALAAKASPLKARMHGAIGSFMDQTTGLLAGIASLPTATAAGGASGGAATTMMGALLRKDAALKASCGAIEQHLKFELQCQHLRQQVAEEDRTINGLTTQLRAAEGRLCGLIERAKPKLEAYTSSLANPVGVGEVFAVAREVGKTTGARPAGPASFGGGYNADMQTKGYLRPYPLPADMSCGWLMGETREFLESTLGGGDPAAAAAAAAGAAAVQAVAGEGSQKRAREEATEDDADSAGAAKKQTVPASQNAEDGGGGDGGQDEHSDDEESDEDEEIEWE